MNSASIAPSQLSHKIFDITVLIAALGSSSKSIER